MVRTLTNEEPERLALTPGDYRAEAIEAGHEEAYEDLCSAQTESAVTALNEGDFETFDATLEAWTGLGSIERAEVWGHFHGERGIDAE